MADALSAQLSSGKTGKLTIQADHDIVVDAAIDGRGGVPGTQLLLNAGNQVRLNANVFTNNAPIGVDVGSGGILPVPGIVFCAGNSSITVRSAGIPGLSSDGDCKANVPRGRANFACGRSPSIAGTANARRC
jgi:hypothetical protein